MKHLDGGCCVTLRLEAEASIVFGRAAFLARVTAVCLFTSVDTVVEYPPAAGGHFTDIFLTALTSSYNTTVSRASRISIVSVEC
jgi:hypothetical protein